MELKIFSKYSRGFPRSRVYADEWMLSAMPSYLKKPVILILSKDLLLLLSDGMS